MVCLIVVGSVGLVEPSGYRVDAAPQVRGLLGEPGQDLGDLVNLFRREHGDPPDQWWKVSGTRSPPSRRRPHHVAGRVSDVLTCRERPDQRSGQNRRDQSTNVGQVGQDHRGTGAPQLVRAVFAGRHGHDQGAAVPACLDVSGRVPDEHS